MVDNFKQLNKLDAAIGEMIAGKYILAEKKIADVLKAIAASDKLVAMMSACVKNFDFAAALEAAKTRDSYNRLSLRLPAERGKQIAFVFCLLVEVDGGKRNFIDFLSEYFAGDGDMHKAYDVFCSDAVVPFAHNVRALAEGGASASQVTASAQKFFEDSEDTLPYDAKEVESLQETLVQITGEITGEPSLAHAERDELLTVADALTHAVLSRNIRFIKIFFIGAKNTAACSSIAKRLLPMFDVLFKKLRACGVI